MVEPAENPSSVPVVRRSPKRRSRRRRPLVYLLSALILWLIGHGVGWFGAAPEPQVLDVGGAGAAVGVGVGQGLGPGRGLKAREGHGSGMPSASGGSAVSVLAAAGASQEQSIGGSVAEPHPAIADDSAEKSPVEGPVEGPVEAPAESPAESLGQVAAGANPPEAEGIAADRFDSLLSLVQHHISGRALGDAAAAVQRLLAQPLSVTQQQQVVALQASLQPLQADLEARILELVRNGEVLQADQQAATLVASGVWSAERLLAAVPTLAIGRDWQRAVSVATAALQKPTPLQRDREVRIRFREQLQLGVIKSTGLHQVTVRLRSKTGQSFPTVPVVACEPVASSAGEAIEMCFAAVHAGEPRLSRLWLLRAHLLAGAATERAQLLAAVLR